jgi:hypothetical protein
MSETQSIDYSFENNTAQWNHVEKLLTLQMQTTRNRLSRWSRRGGKVPEILVIN